MEINLHTALTLRIVWCWRSVNIALRQRRSPDSALVISISRPVQHNYKVHTICDLLIRNVRRLMTKWQNFYRYLRILCRSQWSRGLRFESAAARFLGLRVQSGRGHECLSLVSVVCCEVEVSVTCRSLVQRSPTESGVSECDREASIMMKLGPVGAVVP